jgi:hypothetical protein
MHVAMLIKQNKDLTDDGEVTKMEKLIRMVDVPRCLLDVYLLKRPRDTNVVGNVAKSWLHSRIYMVTNITCSHLHDEATRSSISQITITCAYSCTGLPPAAGKHAPAHGPMWSKWHQVVS